MVRALAAGVLLLAGGRSAEGGNLLTNEAFSQGNTGFTSGYSYNPYLGGSAGGGEGNYFVGADPISYNGNAAAFDDHTTGTGLMLLANGSEKAGTPVWGEQVNVAPHRPYRVSGWFRSWGGRPSDPNPAIVEFSVNGGHLPSPLSLPAGTTSWVQGVATWESGPATSAAVVVTDLNTAGGGNDFALDDLFFGAFPLGDANEDGVVNFKDLLIVARHYGKASAGLFTNGDFDENGKVDFTDLVALARHYGQTIAGTPGNAALVPTSVPEPAQFMVYVSLSLSLRRRREVSRLE
jgi:hypothetical protein